VRSAVRRAGNDEQPRSQVEQANLVHDVLRGYYDAEDSDDSRANEPQQRYHDEDEPAREHKISQAPAKPKARRSENDLLNSMASQHQLAGMKTI
jgi:hypothetical protein